MKELPYNKKAVKNQIIVDSTIGKGTKKGDIVTVMKAKNNMGIIISTPAETYEIIEGKEAEWFSYITSIKLKPGDVVPRFDEFFKLKKNK